MAFVTFIHGIANKPPSETLRQIWLDALRSGRGGVDLPANGIDTQMVYWADVFYDAPVSTDESMESFSAEATAEELADTSDADMSWMSDTSPEEKAFVASIAAEVMVKAEAADVKPVTEVTIDAAGERQESVVLERIPLPWVIKEPLMKRFLRDVHHYLFNTEVKGIRARDEIRRRFVSALRSADNERPHLVVSHSMGTVIAYDCLKRVLDCPTVDGIITIGSPLGLDEVQDKLQSESGGPGWTRRDGYPSERVRGGWGNIYDKLDPVVGFDPQFANDYQRGGERVVEDINEQNFGRWRHDITKYLAGAKLRELIGRMLR
jgi:hypothetical protein